MSDPCLSTLAALSAQLDRRGLSPVELTQACLDRIARHDPVLDSFITVTAEQALAAAREAEQAIMRGERRGKLHGIPYALKDIYDTAGLRTTGHSARCAERVPAEDAATVAKLREAGAVLLGKLATHEFATGGPSYDLPWPPARNPWDPARFAGGSSSGSGVAVAAGFAPLAMGSDTGGSIRLPAAFCGVAGIKPTYGRVSKRGVLPLSWTMDNAGPLARSAEDCALALQAVAGHDPRDPCSADRPVPDFRADLTAGVRGLRIGLVRHFYEGPRADPQMVAAMEAAQDVFRDLGAEVVEVTLPPLAAYQACMRLIVLAESFAIHGDMLRRHPERYGEVFRYRIMPGAFVTAADYVQAQREQRRLAQATHAALRDVDVLLTATIFAEAPVMASMRAEANFAAPPLTPPFNVAGVPAITIRNGFSAAGLPLSMQIAGRPWDEVTVFRVAHAYDTACGWHTRWPELPLSKPFEAPVDQAAQKPGSDCRNTVAAMADIAGLHVEDRQLDQLCEALPHVDALRQALPRDAEYGDETANAFVLESTHAG